MRRIKPALSRHGWRALLGLAAAFLGVALVAGCAPFGSTATHIESSGGGYAGQSPASGGNPVESGVSHRG